MCLRDDDCGDMPSECVGCTYCRVESIGNLEQHRIKRRPGSDVESPIEPGAGVDDLSVVGAERPQLCDLIVGEASRRHPLSHRLQRCERLDGVHRDPLHSRLGRRRRVAQRVGAGAHRVGELQPEFTGGVELALLGGSVADCEGTLISLVGDSRRNPEGRLTVERLGERVAGRLAGRRERREHGRLHRGKVRIWRVGGDVLVHLGDLAGEHHQDLLGDVVVRLELEPQFSEREPADEDQLRSE